jgi:hypothetical protein
LIGTAAETAHRSELLCAPQTVLPAGDRGGFVEIDIVAARSKP